MTVSVIAPVNNYAGNSSAVNFDFDFYIEDETQLDVFLTDASGVQSKLIYGSDYSIHEFKNKNGSYITYPIAGSSHSVLSSDEIISLVLTLPIKQDKEYNNSNVLHLSVLEYSLDYLTLLIQILNRQLQRALKVKEGTDIDTDALAQSLRITADNIDNINTVKENISDVNTVSESITNINAVSDALIAVNTVSSNIEAVNTVKDNISNVSAAGASISNINSVAGALTAVNTVSNNISSVNTVSGISSAVSNVSNISSAVSAVSANASNINKVSNSIGSVNTVSANISNVSAAGASIANINAVSGALTAVNNVSNNISDVNNVSGSISNINAVSADLTNIDAAARHLTNIDNAQIWAEGSDAQVQAIGGTHSAKGWAESSGNADISLSNLNDKGNAKFQYAPFAINSGSIDSSGNNNTLITPGGVPVSVNKYIIPELSSNSSEYGICNDYTLTLPARDGNEADTNPFTMELADDNHIPSGASVTLTLKSEFYLSQPGSYTISNGCQGCAVTYTYTDNTTEKIYDENASGNFAGWGYGMSGVHSAEFVLPIASKEVKGISITFYTIPGGTEERLWVWGVTFKAQYIMSSSDTLICSPCTITTADGKSKTFNADNVLNINENPSNPIANYTVIGSPIVSSDFIASGFSSGNYISKVLDFSNTDSWKVVLCVKTASVISSQQQRIIDRRGGTDFIGAFIRTDGSLWMYIAIANNTGLLGVQTDILTPNTDYTLEFGYNSGNYYVKVKELNLEYSAASNLRWTSSVLHSLGCDADGRYFLGSIDLKTFKIYVNGELEYSAVNQADGNYKVLKSYEDGSLKLVNSLAIQKTPPASGLWLDNSRSPLMLKNFSVIGSPVISADGIASGFSNSNYLRTSDIDFTNPWEITAKFKINASGAGCLWYLQNGGWFNYVYLGQLNNLIFSFKLSDNSEKTLITVYAKDINTNYIYKTGWNGAKYYTKLYSSGGALLEEHSVDSALTLNITGGYIQLGYGSSGRYSLNGSIDLKEFKIYAGSKLFYEAVSNDVYIGDASVSGGVITAVKNNYFNACPAFRYPIETYQSGASWYEIYSDGWIRQGGYFTNTLASAGETSITFLKPFKDTNYSFSRSMKTLSDAQNSDAFSAGWLSKTPSAVTFYSHANNLAAGYDWIAQGF